MAEAASDKSSGGFFATGTVATLAGSTAAVVIVTNTVTGVTGGSPEWLPLVFAMACSLGVYQYTTRGKSAGKLKTPLLLRYTMVVLNGCLIYTSAFGVQGVVASESIAVVDGESTAEAASESHTLSTWTSPFAGDAIRQARIKPVGLPVRDH